MNWPTGHALGGRGKARWQSRVGPTAGEVTGVAICRKADEYGTSPEHSGIRDSTPRKVVDSELLTTQDATLTAEFLAMFPINALAGQFVLVSHGGFML